MTAVTLWPANLPAQQSSRSASSESKSGSVSYSDPKLRAALNRISNPQAKKQSPQPTSSDRDSFGHVPMQASKPARRTSFPEPQQAERSEPPVRTVETTSPQAASHESQVRRASYEPPVYETQVSSPTVSESAFEQAEPSAAQPEPLRSVPALVPAESGDSKMADREVTPAVAVREAEMFLDLTGESPMAASAASGGIAGDSAAEISAASSPTQVIMRAVAWVVIALCLFSLAALGVRRWQRERGLLPTSNSRSRVIETLSLGPGRSVSLIEMSGYRALVAFDAGGIKQLVLAPTSFHDTFKEAEDSSEDDLSLYTAQASTGPKNPTTV
jgi:flagellar biogenesis protein FliO